MAQLDLGSLMVKIEADGTGVFDTLDAVQEAVGKTTKSMEKIGTSMTKAATVPLATLFTAAVKSASDLTETLSKTETVFGKATDSVLKWSETSVEAMGLAQGTALDMASAYGDMATAMGFGETAAASMSMQLTQLAADLASFKNMSTDQVQTALTGVFTGETESLKSLGIVMTQTNLQAYALSQGITKQVSAMSQAEQVQLRYSYVMAQTAKAQGDFQRTGNSMANQTRKLVQTLKQAGESFGKQLLPMVTACVEKLQSAVQWFSELDSGAKNIIVSVGLVTAAIGPLLLAGAKIMKLVTGLKAAMAVMSLNPVILGIIAAGAAIMGLTAALNSANDEVDTASAEYQRFKNIVDDSVTAKVSVDASGIAEYNKNPEKIIVGADVQSALDAAQGVVDALTNGDYDGDLAIDGDTTAADAALAELEAAIIAVKEDVTIGADGTAVLDPESGAIAKLQAAIKNVEGIVAITEDPVTKLTLETRLTELRTELSTLEGSLTLKFSEDPNSSQAMADFKAKLDEMPKNEEYGGTGKFVISGATTEVIQEYTEALAAAASATGDYAGAVDNLNKIADQEKQRKIQEVQRQGSEAAQMQARLLSSGIITEEQYDAQIEKIVNDMTAQIEAIEKENEALKKANEIFNDKSRANDYEAFGEGMKTVNAGQGVTAEDTATAMEKLRAASADGADMSQLQVEGLTVLAGLLSENSEAYAQLTQAVEQYNQAMSEVDAEEKQANETYQQKTGMIDALKEGIRSYWYDYNTGLGEEAGTAAIDSAMQQLSGKLEALGIAEEEFRTALSEAVKGEDGQFISNQAAVEAAYDQLNTKLAAAEEQYNSAVETTKTAREEAEAQLTSYLDTINQGLNSNQTQFALGLVEATGVEVSEAQETAIVGGKQIIEQLAAELESGSTDIQAAAKTAVSGLTSIAIQTEADGAGAGAAFIDGVKAGVSSSEGIGTAASTAVSDGLSGLDAEASSSGSDIGGALMDGMKSGITAKANTIANAAASAVRAAIAAAKAEAEINSPSRVMKREVGAQLMAGVPLGFEEELPKAMKSIKSSMGQLISGATAVVDHGAYTTPALPVPASANINYALMGEAFADAVAGVNISLGVNGRKLAETTREDNAQQNTIYVNRINRGYGG